MINKVNLIIKYFVQACIMQLFMVLISLPILVSWGLPISFLSVIGNIIMTPFLMLFLLLGSTIFFTELFHIPNQWIIWFYEVLSANWLWLLEKQPLHMLYGFKKPSVGMLIILASIAGLCILALNRHPFNNYKLIIASSVMLLLMLCNSYWYALQPVLHRMSTGKGELVIVRDGNTTIVIDPGYIGRFASAASWVESTLTPEIIKNTGCMHIDYLILMQPQPRLLEAITRLFPTFIVHYVVMPVPKQLHDPRMQAFIHQLDFHSIQLIDNPLLQIALSGVNTCTVRQTGTIDHTSHYSYITYSIMLTINGNQLEILSAHTTIKTKKNLSI